MTSSSSFSKLENGTDIYSDKDPDDEKSCLKNIQIQLLKLFSLRTIKRRIPLLTWAKEYNKETFIGDMVAGFTVGLMIIPQSLAYGIIAGLSPAYGLYTAFMGCFVYFFLGSARVINVGPTAVLSLMIMHYTSHGGADYAVLVTLITGVVELIVAIFNIGFLVNFISKPVISGFTSAAAITIAVSQLKTLAGMKLRSRGVTKTAVVIFGNLDKIRYEDLILGSITIAMLFMLKSLTQINWSRADQISKGLGRTFKKAAFFFSVGRNAIVVLLGAVIAYCVNVDDFYPFSLTGHVEAGVPTFQIPPFTTTSVNNQTMEFNEMLNDIGIGIVVIPFIAILYHIAIANAMSDGNQIDATQEIFALAVTNICGSFVRSMPCTSCFSRTAVNKVSGSKTPAAGLLTGIIVLMALAFLTPCFRYIPKTSLSAVIISALVTMVDYKIVMDLWKSKKVDIIPLIITFLGCLFLSLEWGLLMGIFISIFMLLYTMAKPSITTKQVTLCGSKSDCILVKIHQGMYYPGTSHIRTAIRKAGTGLGKNKIPVTVDCSQIECIDYTTAKGLQGTIEEFNNRLQLLIFLGMKPKILSIFTKVVEEINICNTMQEVEEIISNTFSTEQNNHIRTVEGDERKCEEDESIYPFLPSD